MARKKSEVISFPGELQLHQALLMCNSLRHAIRATQRAHEAEEPWRFQNQSARIRSLAESTVICINRYKKVRKEILDTGVIF
jgi:hypothetical protein